jgi:hypothetical protein
MAELKLAIGVDTRQAIRETKNLGKSLDSLADDFEKAAKEGDVSVDDMIRSLRELSRVAKTEGKETGHNLSKGVSDGVKDAKSEIGSSGREAAASFSGGFDDVGDFAQEAAANAFAGFGPAGAIAGTAAAVGIGIATAAIQAANEEVEGSKQKAAEWAQAFIEAGSTIATAATVAAGLQDIATDPEKYDKAKDAAKKWGVDVSTAMRIMAGDSTAIQVVKDRIDDLWAANEAQIESDGRLTEATAAKKFELIGAGTALGKVVKEMEGGAEAAKNVSDGLVDIINQTGNAILEVDEFGNQLYTLPEGEQIVIDADTGQASLNLDQFKGDVDSIPDQHVTRVKVIPDTKQWDAAMKRLQAQFSQGKTIVVRPGQVVYQ